MVLNVDVTPTILALAGIKVPDSYHGENLMAFYKQAPDKWRSSIFLEHRLEGNPLLIKTDGIRDSTWKFIRYDEHPDFIELYNHRDDPNETVNLAFDEDYSIMVRHYVSLCDSAVNTLMADQMSDQ